MFFVVYVVEVVMLTENSYHYYVDIILDERPPKWLCVLFARNTEASTDTVIGLCVRYHSAHTHIPLRIYYLIEDEKELQIEIIQYSEVAVQTAFHFYCSIVIKFFAVKFFENILW